MTNYYATAYKTGSYPVLTEDSIYLWARPHPKDANAPDPIGKPTNFELVRISRIIPLSVPMLIHARSLQDQDMLWAVVFATAPATVTLYTSDSNSQTFTVQQGVNKLSMMLTPGGYMRGTVTRNGQTVLDLRPQGYTFNANPDVYNYNAFTASASTASA